MKKILALLLCSTMVICSLTACGSSDEAEAVAPVVEKIEETATETASTDAAGACSDATFADLQTIYSNLSEAYNLLADFYLNNDDVEKNDDIEETLNLAKGYIDEVGTINQEDITEEDALTLADSMMQVFEGLNSTAQALDLLAEAGAAANAGCSDETFASLQQAYAAITELTAAVTDYYLNTDSVEKNDDIESVLNDANKYIEIAGNVNQNEITEADAVQLAESMADIVEALTITAAAMGIE